LIVQVGPTFAVSDWVLYGGLAWVALAGFFWALLAVSARADRRDDEARVPRRATSRFARARARLRPHASVARSGDEEREELSERRQRRR
jgi:hypothetical protein